MKFKYNFETKLTEIGAETDDICLFCSLFEEDCPLMGGLEINLVYPSANRITIAECPMYEPIDIEELLNKS
jgi:hypothetical protein